MWQQDITTKKHSNLFSSKSLSLPKGTNYSLCSYVNHWGSTPQEGYYNLVLCNEPEDTFVLLDDEEIKLNFELDMSRMAAHYLLTYVERSRN